jgi:hypothetical protein
MSAGVRGCSRPSTDGLLIDYGFTRARSGVRCAPGAAISCLAGCCVFYLRVSVPLMLLLLLLLFAPGLASFRVKGWRSTSGCARLASGGRGTRAARRDANNYTGRPARLEIDQFRPAADDNCYIALVAFLHTLTHQYQARHCVIIWRRRRKSRGLFETSVLDRLLAACRSGLTTVGSMGCAASGQGRNQKGSRRGYDSGAHLSAARSKKFNFDLNSPRAAVMRAR